MRKIGGIMVIHVQRELIQENPPPVADIGPGPSMPGPPDPFTDGPDLDQPLLFPEVTVLTDCTRNVCRNQHVWTPMLALAQCGYGTPDRWVGCRTPVLAVKMSMCPQCNEPPVRFHLRVDHIPGPVRHVIPLCVPGSSTTAEVAEVVMTRKNHIEHEEGKQNG